MLYLAQDLSNSISFFIINNKYFHFMPGVFDKICSANFYTFFNKEECVYNLKMWQYRSVI